VILRSIKFLLAAPSIWLIGWLFWQNLVPAGHFEVAYNFKPSPFISALRPPERLTKTKFTEVGSRVASAAEVRPQLYKEQGIIGDPVYFDLRLPSSFENVEIIVLHEYKPDQKLTISAFTDRKNWKFVTPEAQLVNPYRDYANGLGLRANFNTTSLDIIDRTITFILGAPDASAQDPTTIYEIKISASKKPLSWREAPAKAWKTFKTKFLILNS